MKFQELTRMPRKLLWAIMMEGVGTTKMMHTYAKHGGGKLKLTPARLHPSIEELQVAGEQLKDVPKSLLFLVVFFVPVPGFIGGYTFMAISVEKWSGDKVKLLPSRFRPILIPAPEPEPAQEQ